MMGKPAAKEGDRTDQIKSRMGGFVQTAFWEVRSEPFGS